MKDNAFKHYNRYGQRQAMDDETRSFRADKSDWVWTGEAKENPCLRLSDQYKTDQEAKKTHQHRKDFTIIISGIIFLLQ